MRKSSLLLVDDHPIVCLGVETLLKGAADFQWLGAVSNAVEALAEAKRLEPDLIVLDLMLAGRDGLELIGELSRAAPQTRIVICSAMEEKIYARRCFEAGAFGYVPKEAGFMALLAAIRSVAAGEPYASDGIKQAIFKQAVGRKSAGPPPGLEGLSNQELCVFRLLGSGLGSAEIAAKLGVSVKTVSTYRERIKNKLNLQNARELERGAEAFFREGALPPTHGEGDSR